MIDGSTIVLDVGKTHSKLSLWDEQGRLVDRWLRANEPSAGARYRMLDVAGIDAWLMESLAVCSRAGRVGRIVPVGHGAAAALIRDGRLFAEPMDYEEPVPESEREAYAAQRDAFAVSGSPFLPLALNLGMQLHRLESLEGPLPDDVTILPWPQYWAWRLSGIAAAEVTSLGCHSDLWRPMQRRFTDLAIRRGWAGRMAPLRPAGDALGTITPEVARTTGLPPDCAVLCGLHDSNAALLAARGHGELANRDVTVISTGTWFVAMRSLATTAEFDAGELPAYRDCLINVDVAGRSVPSGRFMGGREAERIGGVATDGAEVEETAEALTRRLTDLLARGARAYPSFVAGVGPFPEADGCVLNLAADARDRRAMASFYLAMMTDTVLGLIGSDGALLVEGRFADDFVFVRSLATIRAEQPVSRSGADSDLAYGALRLVAPGLSPPAGLTRVEPLAVDLVPYADDWRRHAGGQAVVNREVIAEK